MPCSYTAPAKKFRLDSDELFDLSLERRVGASQLLFYGAVLKSFALALLRRRLALGLLDPLLVLFMRLAVHSAVHY